MGVGRVWQEDAEFLSLCFSYWCQFVRLQDTWKESHLILLPARVEENIMIFYYNLKTLGASGSSHSSRYPGVCFRSLWSQFQCHLCFACALLCLCLDGYYKTLSHLFPGVLSKQTLNKWAVFGEVLLCLSRMPYSHVMPLLGLSVLFLCLLSSLTTVSRLLWPF